MGVELGFVVTAVGHVGTESSGFTSSVLLFWGVSPHTRRSGSDCRAVVTAHPKTHALNSILGV